jgi:hypothetical protein
MFETRLSLASARLNQIVRKLWLGGGDHPVPTAVTGFYGQIPRVRPVVGLRRQQRDHGRAGRRDLGPVP